MENRIITPNGEFDPDLHWQILKKVAGDDWKFDDNNIPVFNYLLYYFNGQPPESLPPLTPFEYNLDKGILIMGNVGTGKTTTFKIIQKYLSYLNQVHPNNFQFIESREIIREFSKDKYTGLEKFTFNPTHNEHGSIHKVPKAICVDDIGLEQDEVKHFGDTVDVMSEFLADRYTIFQDRKFRKLTHATTNLDRNNLKKKYSERIADRMREMFNIIQMNGESRRK